MFEADYYEAIRETANASDAEVIDASFLWSLTTNLLFPEYEDLLENDMRLNLSKFDIAVFSIVKSL